MTTRFPNPNEPVGRARPRDVRPIVDAPQVVVPIGAQVAANTPVVGPPKPRLTTEQDAPRDA